MEEKKWKINNPNLSALAARGAQSNNAIDLVPTLIALLIPGSSCCAIDVFATSPGNLKVLEYPTVDSRTPFAHLTQRGSRI